MDKEDIWAFVNYHTLPLWVSVGFCNPRKNRKTSIAVLSVCDTLTFPLRLFIVRNSPSPTRLILIAALTSTKG